MISKLRNYIKKFSPIKKVYDWNLFKVRQSVRWWNGWKNSFLWKYQTKRFMLPRIFNVLTMMITFHIRPEYVYKFSTHRRLMPRQAKYNKQLRPGVFPFKVHNEKSTINISYDEISIVMRGASFNLQDLKVVPQPLFFVGYANNDVLNRRSDFNVDWSYISKLDEIIKINRIPIIHVHSIIKYHRILIENRILRQNDMKFLFLNYLYKTNDSEFRNLMNDPDTKWYKTINDERLKTISVYQTLYDELNTMINPTERSFKRGVSFTYFPFGSGVVTISALYPFARKINIFGWDFHLNSSPEKMNYLELFLNSYKYNMDRRARDHFECALINYYYGYHLSKLPKINVHGFLGELDKHEKLINRIERVLYES